MQYHINVYMESGNFSWALICESKWVTQTLASGTSPDYHQACEQARIAWEQHSKGDA